MALVKKIDHVAVVVRDVEKAAATFSRNFGFEVESGGQASGPLGTLRARLRVGDDRIELDLPGDEQGAAARFLADRGEGMYMLSLAVDDLDAARSALAKRGIPVKLEKGADGARVGSLRPEHTHGVLLQLVEAARA